MQIASTSGRSSRSTFTHTNRSFISAAMLGVLEGLVRHHVAPVAGRVADRDEQRPVLVARARRAPLLPTDTSRPDCPCAGSRYGELWPARRFGTRPGYPNGARSRRANTLRRLPKRGAQLSAHRESISAPAHPPPLVPTSTPYGPAACCSAPVRSRSIQDRRHRRATAGGPGRAVPGEPRRGVSRRRGYARRRGATDGLPDRHGLVRGGQRGVRVVLRIRPAGPRGDRRGGAAPRRQGRNRRGGGAP